MTTGNTNIVLQSPGGRGQIDFNLLRTVAWDRHGCPNGNCPPTADIGSGQLSAGVSIIGNNLTAIAISGKPGQGVCVSPVVVQHNGFFYWEYTWLGLSDPNASIGLGVIEIGSIPEWDALAATGAGGCIVRPNGDLWRDGDFFASGGSGFAPQAEGDTMGMFIHLDANIGNSIAFYGVGGSILNQSTPSTGLNNSNLGGRGGFVPAAAFDSVSQFDTIAVTANFKGPFLGTSVLPPSFFNGVTLGWPGIAS